jgi:hypothetical protein
MKLGFSGHQDVRWYSGRTARWHPWEAAERMCFSAAAKFAAGSTS